MDKNDWIAASEELVADERERLGPPPSAAEVRAYLRGELPPEEAERIRDLLVCYPDLALSLTAAPGEGAARILSDEELAANWNAMQTRLAERRRREARRRIPVRVPPIAAMLVIGVATIALLQWRWNGERERLTRQLHEPRVHGQRHTLEPIATRGSSGPHPYRLPAGEENFLLAPALVNSDEYSDYRVEIVGVSVSPPKTVWTRSGVPRTAAGTLELSVPRAFLRKGIYRIDIYGDAAKPELIANYLIEAP